MAVIIQYVVERNGVQKMVFTSKKEADAYDKMLDVADHLFDFIQASGADIDEAALETISLYLAENGQETMNILKGGKPKIKAAAGDEKPEPMPKKKTA